jgi:hypothetical protein
MSFIEKPKIVINQMNRPFYGNHYEKSNFNLLSTLCKPAFASVCNYLFFFRIVP